MRAQEVNKDEYLNKIVKVGQVWHQKGTFNEAHIEALMLPELDGGWARLQYHNSRQVGSIPVGSTEDLPLYDLVQRFELIDDNGGIK